MRDNTLPTALLSVPTFHKEKEMFWPPPSYSDHKPLPEAWLAMLTPADMQSYTSSLRIPVVDSQTTQTATKIAAKSAATTAGSPSKRSQDNTSKVESAGRPADQADQAVDDSNNLSEKQRQFAAICNPHASYAEMYRASMRFDEIEGLEECIGHIQSLFTTMLQSTQAAALMSHSVNVATHTRTTNVAGMKIQMHPGQQKRRVASMDLLKVGNKKILKPSQLVSKMSGKRRNRGRDESLKEESDKQDDEDDDDDDDEDDDDENDEDEEEDDVDDVSDTMVAERKHDEVDFIKFVEVLQHDLSKVGFNRFLFVNDAVSIQESANI